METVRPSPAAPPPGATGDLRKVLWANIVELRLAEESRRKRRNLVAIVLSILGLAVAALVLARML